MARDWEYDLVTNFDCVYAMNARGVFFSWCVDVFVVLYVVYECVWLYSGKGQRVSPFQHQQADESLGPNSLEAELALLLSPFFSLTDTNNLS